MKLTETEDYKKLPYRFQWLINEAIKAGEEHNKEKTALTDQIKALTDFVKPEKFKEYSKYPEVWNDTRYNYGTTDSKTPRLTVDQLKELLAKEEIIYTENKVIAANNEKARAVIFAFMARLGIPKTRSERTSSRSYKTHEVKCAWVTEIENIAWINPEPGWRITKEWYENQIKAVEKYHADKLAQTEAIEKERAAELKRQERDALIVKMVQKYNLTFDTPIPELYEVIEQVAKQNKYLYLARYLSKNRGDWNDGSAYAKQGLDYFISVVPDNETLTTDHEIYTEIDGYISDWGGDGTVFRDCKWNYDALYSFAENRNKSLYDDFNKLVSYE